MALDGGQVADGAASGAARPAVDGARAPRGGDGTGDRPARPKHIASLQGLRFVAAALVVFFHLDHFAPAMLGMDGAFLGGLFQRGEAGVDVFFVLSGFIILYTTLGRARTRRGFLRARFVRIYPIYWVIVGALVAAELVGITHGHANRVDPAVIVPSMLLVPAPEYVIEVTWTLVIEMLFYGCFALTFFIRPRVFFATLGVWAALAIVNRIAPFAPAPDWLFGYLLYSGILEFFFGAAIAWTACHHEGRLPFGWTALALGSALFAYTLVGPVPEVLGRELIFGVPSALIVYGAFVADPWTPRFAVEIGDASYVLYLMHGPAIVLTFKVLTALGLDTRIGPVAVALAGATVAIAASWVIHRLVERPLLRLLRPRRRPAPAPTPALARTR